MLTGRSQERLSVTAAQIDKLATGETCHTIAADLLEPAEQDALVEGAVEALGAVDILVHSAGIYERSPFEQTSPESLDRHWSTNVRAPFLLTQRALPHIAPGGSIIFLTSVAARTSIPNGSAYCSTKAALESLTGVLAIELAPRDVRVNAVAPGFTKTPMNERLRADPEVMRTTLSAIPAGRLGTVEDIAPAVVFLASDAARYITGEVFHIDGGYPTAFALPGSGEGVRD